MFRVRREPKDDDDDFHSTKIRRKKTEMFTCVNFPDDISHNLQLQSSPPVIKYWESARNAIQVILPSVWSIERTTRASSNDQIFKLKFFFESFLFISMLKTYKLSPIPETTYFPSGETPSILHGTLNLRNAKGNFTLFSLFEQLTESINSPECAHQVLI